MARVKVKSSKNYDVIIEKGILDSAGDIIKRTSGGDAVCIVTDDTVDALYSQRLIASLEQAGYLWRKFVIPHGEQSKNAENFIALLNFLAENHFTRTDTVAALGGGVVGDLAGFAAASYTRGMNFVQIPTTLLSCVDSSVGGKTAIDLDTGKNLAGAFYQPNVVICDYSTLDTLPDDIFTDGCAEVIKYAVIADDELFELLKKPIKENLEKVITRCVEIKRDVVCKDEFDTGLRRILNFGHTVGHAVEAKSNFEFSHGKSVAVGMAVVARATVKTGNCTQDTADEIISLIQSYGLPTYSPYAAEELTEKALSDKKRKGDYISLVIPIQIGTCKTVNTKIENLNRFISAGIE